MIEYDEDLIKIFKRSELEAKELSHQLISTEHVILAVLKVNNKLAKIFSQLKISYNDFKKVVIKNIPKDNNIFFAAYSPLLKKIILESTKSNIVTLKELIINILSEENSIAYTLLKIIKCDIQKLIFEIKNEKKLKYGINLNDEIINDTIYTERKELKELIEVLCRKNKCNPLLIGEAGVGKTALVEALAQKINNNEVPNELQNKKIISINMASLLSGTKYRGEFEEKIESLIKEVENNPDYILFIDEAHTILNTGSQEGSIDAGNILKPYLARNKIKLITATTINEYNNSIKKDKALNRRFHTIYVDEPNKKETKQILLSSKKDYESFHKIRINERVLNKIIELSQEYLKDKKEPDRSLDILDKACTIAKINKSNITKIKKLQLIKENYIRLNKLDKAKEINIKISNFKNKKYCLTIDDILKCYSLDNKKQNIGFKISL